MKDILCTHEDDSANSGGHLISEPACCLHWHYCWRCCHGGPHRRTFPQRLSCRTSKARHPYYPAHPLSAAADRVTSQRQVIFFAGRS